MGLWTGFRVWLLCWSLAVLSLREGTDCGQRDGEGGEERGRGEGKRLGIEERQGVGWREATLTFISLIFQGDFNKSVTV